MEQKARCQSCGMPLAEGNYGTNQDTSENKEYCKFCFQKGDFTEPHMTVYDMIKESIHHMTTSLHMPEPQAKQLSESVIPTLKRWKKS